MASERLHHLVVVGVAAVPAANGSSGEGVAYVFLGSASGLASSAAWSKEADLASAALGTSVASAGDVNGDGYGDIVVGADGYTNGSAGEGAAFVYLGGASGLGTAATWTGEGNQIGAGFGTAVAAAGDANGDGYADIAVGADQYDNGQTDEGRKRHLLRRNRRRDRQRSPAQDQDPARAPPLARPRPPAPPRRHRGR